MGAAPGKTEQVDDAEDDFSSESTEEVPALHGTPVVQGGPYVDSQSVSTDPDTVQELKTQRAVYTLPPSAQHTYPQDCVLKLCMVR